MLWQLKWSTSERTQRKNLIKRLKEMIDQLEEELKADELI